MKYRQSVGFFSTLFHFSYSIPVSYTHLDVYKRQGLITAAVLLFVYEARPEMLSCSEERAKSRFSFKKTIAILGIAALEIGGAVSLAASSNPDGLESVSYTHLDVYKRQV